MTSYISGITADFVSFLADSLSDGYAVDGDVSGVFVTPDADERQLKGRHGMTLNGTVLLGLRNGFCLLSLYIEILYWSFGPFGVVNIFYKDFVGRFVLF